MKKIKRHTFNKASKVTELDLNKTNSSHLARTYYNTGLDLHKRGNINKAITNYQKSIQIDPTFIYRDIESTTR